MYSKFEGLDEEKQQRILNAAMIEFAAKGFDDASTNSIVEGAGISKGLLFHYFKSKRQLFFYLYDRSIQLFLDQFYQKMDMEEQDLIAKLHKILLVKMELVRKHPGIMEFLKAAYLEDSHAVKQEMDDHNKDLINQNIARVFENIDRTRFRRDVDADKVIHTVVWAFEGYSNDFLRKEAKQPACEIDYDGMFADARRYVEFLKQCFYEE